MAGTGELNYLRRLRVSHGHFGEGVTYGTHLASHMSLGLLFAGRGLYTVGTSNTAVAALLMSFYPVWPKESTDNRTHLQAWRSLWVLAVEKRVLEARDVETGERSFLPVKLRVIETGPAAATGQVEVKAKQLVAPTLIPELKLIHAIQVDTPRYWPFQLHLNHATSPLHFHPHPYQASIDPTSSLADLLPNGLTLHVKRRTGHLSYARDPRGIRSIFTRSKSETGASVLDFGATLRRLNPASSGLRDFIDSFGGAGAGGGGSGAGGGEQVEATVEYLCSARSSRGGEGAGGETGVSEFEAFEGSVLLECLTRDKRDTVGVYRAMRAASTRLARDRDALALLGAEQLALVVDFYQASSPANASGQPTEQSSSSRAGSGSGSGFDKWFYKPSSKSSTSRTIGSTPSSLGREPLVQSALITYVATSSRRREQERFSNDERLARAVKDYLRRLANPEAAAAMYPDESVREGMEGALGMYLLEHRVPSLASLRTLRALCRECFTARGRGEKEEARRERVAVMLGCTRRLVDEQGERAWTSEVEPVMLQAWLTA